MKSNSITERYRGLGDLKYVLEANRRNPVIPAKVKDNACHTLFELLFRLASKERSVYAKASINNTKDISAGRLESIASVTRIAVDIMLPKMRAKTVKALLGHIIEILPMPSGGLCQPLSLDYLKALKQVLDCSAHVEHLPRTAWLNAIDFCIGAYKILKANGVALNNIVSNSTSTSMTLNGSIDLNSKTTAVRPSRFSGSHDIIIELFHCLSCLTVAPNSPLLERAVEILDLTSDYLQGSPSGRSTHHSVLVTINAVLARVSLDSAALMNKSLLKIIPMLKRLWELKNVVLLDEVLITLIQSKAHLIALVKTKTDDLIDGVEALLGVVADDYFDDLRFRGHLYLDDLGLDVRNAPRNDVMPMQTRSFHLRKATVHAEHNWTVLHFLAFLSCWIDVRRPHECRDDENDNDLDSLRKRRRIAQRLEDLLRQTCSISISERLYSLQVIAFLVHQRAFSDAEMLNIVRCLVTAASHQNGSVSSWAFLGLAG